MWTGLSPEEARSLLVQKDKAKRDKRMSLSEAVATFVQDGYTLGIGGFVNSRQPVATVHEIIRQGKQNLILVFHSAGLAVEYLAGAMAQQYLSLKRLEFAYMGIELFGISSMLRYLAENGLVELEDWSNFNMSARFKAAAMGLPFLPCRSPLGTDVIKANRAKIIDCPFTGQPIALVPACHPQVALIHVQEADIYGNCRIEGPLFTCPEIALAAALSCWWTRKYMNFHLPQRRNSDLFGRKSIPMVTLLRGNKQGLLCDRNVK
ncbi:CoA transferase subunit A [Desulforamulus ferrireducens]|uniref:CoA transferase subunit A n=1 Tax=Desulforamulus ferrireducens TaxID=1833852 RepID=UPI00098BA69E|nr:CoA transferase [Desulforamulus ferrireducens]